MLSAVLVSGCGSDSDGTVYVLKASELASRQPAYVVRGRRVEVQVWQSPNTSSRAGQLLYRDKQTGQRTRIVLERADDEAPMMIVDEATGDYAVVRDNGAGRVDFLQFKRDDTFAAGFALTAQDDKFYLARVHGVPAFRGQVQGQLKGSSSSGSFAVVARDLETMSDKREVTQEMRAILRAQSGGRGNLTSKSGVSGKAAALTDWDLSRTLKIGGVLLGGAALAGVFAPAYGAAGVAMIASGFFSDQLGDFIEQGFVADEPFAQSLTNLAIENLRKPDSEFATTLTEFVQRVTDHATGKIADDSVEAPDNAPRLREVEEYTERDDIAPSVTPSELPPDDGEPPAMTVTVTGQAVWQDQTSYVIEGTANAEGTLTFESMPDPSKEKLTAQSQIDEDGTVMGTFTRGSEMGTLEATVTEVGECEAVQASGGQGTFTNAHFVGVGSGSVSFDYDAYGIPDAFDVSVEGQTRFSTGGLVSGAGQASIPVGESGLVFVSVSAPEDGTAWDYSLSCLGMTTDEEADTDDPDADADTSTPAPGGTSIPAPGGASALGAL